MDESLRLGRIAGVRVGINWSVLAIFWLIAWGLAADRLPAQYPGYQDGAYWGAGIFAAIIFFASLLAHEIGHAVVARRQDVEVEGITLWLFGGVARLKGEAMTPSAELKIAVVGPVVSLVLAGLFTLVGVVLDAGGSSVLLAGSFVWLGRINGVLAIFNMVPAFPLDGGRVLRALLWRKRSRARSTEIAARAGQIFGYLLIGLGLVSFGFRADIGGLWLVFLGWFLLGAAKAERYHSVVRDTLGDTRVREVMSEKPVSVPDWIDVATFVDNYVPAHRHSSFPLRGFDGSPAGIVTLDRVKRVAFPERPTTRLRDVAIPMENILLARPEERVVNVLERMANKPYRRILVVGDDGAIAGIVTQSDISRAVDAASLRRGEAPQDVAS